MYTITLASSGGSISFDTVEEIEKFIAGAVYGVILDGQVNGVEMPVDSIAQIIIGNLSIPGVEIDIDTVTAEVEQLVYG